MNIEQYKITEDFITFDPFEPDDGILVPESLKPQLEELFEMAVNGEKSGIAKLKRFIKQYPKVLHLQDYLVMLLNEREEREEAFAYTQQMHEQFPDYLFARVGLAREYLMQSEFEKALELIGDKLELRALYPKRKLFHINEVFAYYDLVVFYLCNINKHAEAEEVVNGLEELSIEIPGLEVLRAYLLLHEMDGVKSFSDTFSSLPEFNHPQILWLYQEDLFIDDEQLEELLSLPRKSLIEDIEKVLLDSIDRYNYYSEILSPEMLQYEEYSSFVLHAFFLLGELRAKESAPVIWEVMRQHYDYFDLFFDDVYLEYMWEPLFKIFHDDFDALTSFMKEPGGISYSKSSVMEVVLQAALHDPQRKPKSEQWFVEMLNFFNHCEEDDVVLDDATIGFLVWTLIDLNLDYMPAAVKELYDKERVDISMLGDYEQAVKEWEERPGTDKNEVLPIVERYAHIIDAFSAADDFSPDEFMDDDEMELDKFLDLEGDAEINDFIRADNDDFGNHDGQPIIKAPKIGRNDPCSCGSGKKYKKCCGR